MNARRRSTLALLAAVALTAGACSGDDDAGDATTAPTTAAAPTTAPATTAPTATTAPATTVPTTTAAPATTEPPPTADGMIEVVTRLAADELTGRNEGTDGWFGAQAYLTDQLAAFAEPIDPAAAGPEGYLQRTGTSVNVIGVVRGAELPDEYVLVGAHYDHLGVGDCATTDPVDTICNGAADNAAGVAVALEAVRAAIAAQPPARSIMLAFWDREEDGLAGSAEFVTGPVVPLEQIVAYVNFDIQGANLSPGLSNATIMVGAETGGPALVEAAARATATSTLDTAALSLIFGQGRSDHASLVAGGVPAVFFTDANNGCYHTAQDDVAHLDTTKLGQQLATATALIGDLATTSDVPTYVPDAPVATFADAEAMLALVTAGQPDFGLLDAADAAAAEAYLAELTRMVAEGEDAFDDADVGTLLGGAAALVEALAHGACTVPG